MPTMTTHPTPINERIVDAAIAADLFFPLEWEAADDGDTTQTNGLCALLSHGRVRALYRDSAATVARMLGRFCSAPSTAVQATPGEILEEYLRGAAHAPGFQESEARRFCSAFRAVLC